MFTANGCVNARSQELVNRLAKIVKHARRSRCTLKSKKSASYGNWVDDILIMKTTAEIQRFSYSVLVTALMLTQPSELLAHGGGTDASGCHNNSRSNSRHCHDRGATEKAVPETLVGTPRLIDGDTFDLAGQRIRIHGIDAPEIGETCPGLGSAILCGQTALLALSKQLDGKAVFCKKTGMDRYGRVVAKCFESDEDIGLWMVRNGWAKAFRKYSLDYVEEEKAARQHGVGIWAMSESKYENVVERKSK